MNIIANSDGEKFEISTKIGKIRATLKELKV